MSDTLPAYGLDHIVLNAKTGLDGLQRAFDELGFLLSPRAVHSLGSINHVAVLPTAYLELIGVPPERPDARPEVSQGSIGVDGLVLRTDDADATYDALCTAGYEVGPVQAFSRPVTRSGAAGVARFRTVRFERSPFTVGRVYFCQHVTPGLVWHAGATDHPNGSHRVRQVVAVSSRPDEQAWQFAALAGRDVLAQDGGYGVQFDDVLVTTVSPKSYREIYGEDALDDRSGTEFFGALTLEFRAPGSGRARAAPEGWCRRPLGGHSARFVSRRHRVLVDLMESA